MWEFPLKEKNVSVLTGLGRKVTQINNKTKQKARKTKNKLKKEGHSSGKKNDQIPI